MRSFKPAKDAAYLVAALLMILSAGVDRAQAQELVHWMNVGNLHNYYANTGIEIRKNIAGFRRGLEWPADNPAEAIHHTRKGLCIARTGFTDEDGNLWAHKIAHVGPRVSGLGELFPVKFAIYSRFPEPQVIVDGAETFNKPIFGGDISFDAIDPTLKADRLIYSELNTVAGITVRRYIYAFSQEYHQDYHVTEWVLVNTGNTDEDEEIEVEGQTATGVYLWLQNKNTISRAVRFVQRAGHGGQTANDFIGDVDKDGNIIEIEHHQDYIDKFGEIDFRATFQWHGYQDEYKESNNLGAPVLSDGPGYIEEGDTLGRLGAAEFIGRVTMHASKSASDHFVDDFKQPTTTTVYWAGHELNNNNLHTDTDKMLDEYTEYITAGRDLPHHADMLAKVADYPEFEYDWIKRMARQNLCGDLGNANNGYMHGVGYGPYTIPPGDSIRIVYAEGIAGLDMETCINVGNLYKRNAVPGGVYNPSKEHDPLTYNGISQSKNEWALSSRDSLFNLFRAAIDNYENGYDIPQPPLPPEKFEVTSASNRIVLTWEPFPGEDPPGGWEIWRAKYSPRGTIDDHYQYTRVASPPASARAHDDSLNMVRGINYFYYIQAVGDVNNDPTGNTPTGVRLKSNRYYTQTWQGARLTREPGETLSSFRIVPNPYQLGSSKEVRWPDVRDQVAFLDIPESAIIKIYTERGDLVRTIDHFGSGDAYWNMQTAAMQRVVSGVYIVGVENKETGERLFKKFVIIR